MDYEEFDFPTCIYCGEPPEQREHVLPKSQTWKFQGNYLSFIVPSCTECNYIAGAKLFRTFGDKTKYIHNHLRKKYRKELNTTWSQSELDDLGPSLRSDVERSIRIKKCVEKRLKWRLESLENVSTVIKISRERNLGKSSARETKIQGKKNTAEGNSTTKKSYNSYETGRRSCANCHEGFMPQKPWQKFCDKECRDEWHCEKTKAARKYMNEHGDKKWSID